VVSWQQLLRKGTWLTQPTGLAPGIPSATLCRVTSRHPPQAADLGLRLVFLPRSGGYK